MAADHEAADSPFPEEFHDLQALEREKDHLRREEARLKRERSEARARGDLDRVAELRAGIQQLMQRRRGLRLRPAPTADDGAHGNEA